MKKMTLKELADRVGIANVNLSKIKTGKVCAIRFSTLVAICEALDCQPGDILEYDPTLPQSDLLKLKDDGPCGDGPCGSE